MMSFGEDQLQRAIQTVTFSLHIFSLSNDGKEGLCFTEHCNNRVWTLGLAAAFAI